MSGSSENISLFEEYLFSADKKEFLDSCKNASEVKKYIRLVHLLNTGEPFEQVDKDLLNQWTLHYSYGDKLNVIIKSKIQEILAETDSTKRSALMKQFNDKFLGFGFYDQRAVAGTQATGGSTDGPQVTLKTAFTQADLDEISTAAKIREAENCAQGSNISFQISSLGPKAIRSINLGNMKSWSHIEQIFNSVEDFSYSNEAVDVLLRYKAYQRGLNPQYNYNWQLPEHLLQKLTLLQLDTLGDKDKDTKTDFNFRKVRFIKKYDEELRNFNEAEDAATQRVHLINLLEKTRKDTESWTDGLSSALHEALLINGYELEEYDPVIFKEYIKAPMFRHNQYNKVYWDTISTQSSSWKDLIRYQPANIPNPDLHTVFESYVKNLIDVHSMIKELEKFFNLDYLINLDVTNRVLKGGSLDEYKTKFGEHAATTLENKKQLEILRRNKRRFGKDDEVKLSLEVKNVAELTYKIFEVDTETFYKKNSSEISDSLDLDGLIPEKIYKLTYAHKKHHAHIEDFTFPDIQAKEKGVFIVEFVGGGISSRALIRKGALSLLTQAHFQGVRVHVIDENKRLCGGPKTGIFVDGKHHAVNESNYVLLPFNESQMSKQVIITHDGFHALGNIVIPDENYELRTAVIFNEESIVAGRKLRVIVKNRLLLNGVPITLKKVEEFNGEIQLTNYDGITNYKHFKDLKLSDAEDLVLEFIVPPMLTRLEVKVNGKLKNLLNKDVFIANSESITINRNEGSDLFVTCYLNRDENGHFVELRGKNGEAIPNRPIVVGLVKTFGNFSFNKEIFTDAHGIARLGKLDDIKTLSVRSNNNTFQARAFIIDEVESQIDINNSYQICEGDQLVLPSMKLALSRNNFDLLKLSAVNSTPVNSFFSNISEEKDTGLLVIKGLTRGRYNFVYNTHSGRVVSIVVHQATRWDSSPLFLELKDRIVEVQNETKYLTVSDLKQDPSSLSFKVISNSLDNARVHILGYHHQSHLLQVLQQRSARVRPHFSGRELVIKPKYNNYRSNRVLSDEHVYVNERKNKQTFIGNTLDKPSILLHREKVRETKDDEEVLNQGGDFGSDNFREKAMDYAGGVAYASRLSKTAAYTSTTSGASLATSYTINSNIDYLVDSGKSLVNLKPAADGSVSVALKDFSEYSHLLVNITDNAGNLFYSLEHNKSAPQKLDMRVAKAKEQGLVYSEDFFTVVSRDAKPGVIEDLAATSNYMIEDLSALLDVLLVIAQGGVNKTELQKWKFLSSWHKLSDEEKFKKLEEYGGHELHLFTFFRDRAFFDAHINPMLRFKAQKELIDYLLLDEREKYESRLRAEHFNQFNILEGVLLAYRLRETNPQACSNYLESLRKRQEVKLANPESRKSKYESILASKKIEEEAGPVRRPGAMASVQTTSTSKGGASNALAAGKKMAMLFGMKKSEAVEERSLKRAKHEEVDMLMDRSEKLSSLMAMDDGLIDIAEESKAQPVKIEKYQKKGAAFEFKERQEYFKGQFQGLNLNNFWLRVVESIVEKGQPLVLGEEIIEMNNSSLDLVLALTFTDLPFVRGTIDSRVDGPSLVISSSTNILIFCKKMEERKTDTLNMEMVVSQKIYDPEDKYIYDEKDPSVKTIKEVREYLTAKIYEARVAYTNLADVSCSFKLIVQIPQGAMPVNALEFFKIHEVSIDTMSTAFRTFKFYFPSPGTFKYYPATIMKNNRFVVAARYGGDLNVVTAFTRDNQVLETLQDILNYGTVDNILDFMRQKNIFNTNLFTIDKVRWIFKSSPENFKKGVEILKTRFLWDEQSWAYSIHHGIAEEFLELLKVRIPGLLQDSLYFRVSGIEVNKFEPLEYDPLINPRAHDISDKKHNILNKTFKETYERFLKYCIERGSLSERERIILVAYLVLQDRIQDALNHLKHIDEKKVFESNTMVVQFEYLRAYLSIYTDGPHYNIARAAAKKYFDFPDLSWRKRFREISKQVSEHDKGQLAVPEEKKGGVQEKTNTELADKSEYLSLELKENFQLAITHKNISQLSISFYKLEMEILFSNDPFLEKDIMNFVSVNPNHLLRYKVQKSGEFKTNTVAIPENLQKDALFIQVKARDRFEIIKSFNSHLRVHAVEDYGLLNVSDLTGKILNSVYVKCFSKKRDGTVKFYKDGYTDFRGSFDYASLNSDSLGDIEKYGLFVYSKEHGSVILTAKPPSQVGRIVKDETPDAEAEEEEVDEEFASAPLLQ